MKGLLKIVGILGGIFFLERRRPLRSETESEIRRNERNLTGSKMTDRTYCRIFGAALLAVLAFWAIGRILIIMQNPPLVALLRERALLDSLMLISGAIVVVASLVGAVVIAVLRVRSENLPALSESQVSAISARASHRW